MKFVGIKQVVIFVIHLLCQGEADKIHGGGKIW